MPELTLGEEAWSPEQQGCLSEALTLANPTSKSTNYHLRLRDFFPRYVGQLVFGIWESPWQCLGRYPPWGSRDISPC